MGHRPVGRSAIWAANGDPKSVVLFGTLAVLSLFGHPAAGTIGFRRDKGALYAPFELSTSNLPMMAVIQGPPEPGGRRCAKSACSGAVGTVVAYGLLLHFHGWIFGAPAFPM